MTGRVRVAVIGAGEFGRLHVRTVAAHPDAILCGVADPSSEALSAVADEVDGHVALVSSIDELPDVDAVVIATPDQSHVEPVRTALANHHHVLVEKPLATSLADGAEICRLAATADRASTVCRVGHVLRFDPRLVWLRALLSSGEIGDPIHLTLHRDGSRDLIARYPRVSPMMQGGVHDLDLATWLTGRSIVAAEAQSVASDAEHFTPVSTTALLELSGGVGATVRASRTLPVGLSPAPHTRLELATTTALVTITNEQPPWCNLATVAPPPPAVSVTAMLAAQFAAFLTEISGKASTELATPDDARRAVATALLIDRSTTHRSKP